jgi:ABC-type branched-subunit amino acid transport system ATPase component
MTPLFACSGLTMRFGGLVALDSLDLTVNAGDVLGLVGPNGSGKTTFFNVVTGVYRPTQGQVLFQGEDVTRCSPQNIYRMGIARTFQRSRLCLDLTIFDNIMLGNHKALNLGFIHNMLKRKSFLAEYRENFEKAAALLHSLNPALVKRMQQPVGALNMMDRRRVEICRALISAPRLLFLDEPSAGMTHDETRRLMDEILAMNTSNTAFTLVLIEHEMEVIKRICTRCVVLNFGKKLCEGDYETVTSDPKVQEAYLGVALE